MTLVVLHPDVKYALREKGPVVALESTIIAHGLPWPDNLQCAQKLEFLIRQEGAIPATIALVKGQIHVGLTHDLLEELAQAGSKVAKVSRRDFSAILQAKRWGATTVAGTMICAHLAGISLFATGGLGGVHRGAEQSFDISADITELAHTPVAVVCAGAKSILDLPKTLEVLETAGVPIIGYQTNTFPAFFGQSSGLPLEHCVETPQALAEILSTQRALGLNNGIIIANPVPRAFALDPAQESAWLEAALREAQDQGIRGKATTPFLLKRLQELSNGATLKANLALVENNARLAAQVAVAQTAFRFSTQ